MRKLSLNELDLGTESLLQREQLVSVLGGGICANNASPRQTNWACADGSASGSAYVCMEHFQAYADVISSFCDTPVNLQ